ncbi:MAG TPA: hypothetical protein VGQ52_17525 [Gemmatimonadaceae bacterium]|jgi:hypothetical protein|nr:hypothetical protein [Gemmatimonadaceae bacterium]
MRTLTFKQLPLVVKIAVGVTFYNTWWALEEFVINRVGLWKYMPGYKLDSACVWDLAVALIITFSIWRAGRDIGHGSAPSGA